MIVTSIVLNWNRRDDTLACLTSLPAGEIDGMTARRLLVDNGSTDDTAQSVRAGLPDVDILALPTNRGYAGGINAGVRRALDDGADWTLLINNDARLGDGALAALLAADDCPRVGMLTPTIRFLDAPDRVWPSAGRRRRLTLAAFDTTADPPSHAPYDVDWATGCCLLVRAALWREVGLFDERYRFYYEDHDLCLRARAAGWRIRHVPAAAALHRVASSTGAGTPAQAYLLARGSVPYYLAHTRGSHRVFIVVYRLGSLARTLLSAVRSGRPAAGRAYLAGIVDGLRDVRSRRGADLSGTDVASAAALAGAARPDRRARS